MEEVAEICGCDGVMDRITSVLCGAEGARREI
jgi:hypothetical protein